ncbi:hypothetical protein LA080_001585 [Diaporthe eres]|nr:hypothetical protein LA080_001585 [Diaporthe eres]
MGLLVLVKGGPARLGIPPSVVPSDVFNSGIAELLMFSAAEIQPFGSVEDYSWLSAAEDFMDFDFSGIQFAEVDFTGVNGDPKMPGMDGGL